ncbi:hypothetical protein Tco_0407672 [Tanacetum coccineum]
MNEFRERTQSVTKHWLDMECASDLAANSLTLKHYDGPFRCENDDPRICDAIHINGPPLMALGTPLYTWIDLAWCGIAFLLKKAIGLFSCDRTAPIAIPEASVVTSNGFVKFGSARVLVKDITEVIHGGLKRGRCIREAERHHEELLMAIRCAKCSLVDICLSYADLMISGAQVDLGIL